MRLKSDGPTELCDSIFWLGSVFTKKIMQVNVYLMYRENSAVLIDPGPISLFNEILVAFRAITNRNNPDFIIITHQDPDVCASLPLWEKNGFTGTIVSHWITALILPSLGVTLPIRVIDKKRNQYDIKVLSLQFIEIPYLHSPGGLAVYDPETRTLFSSDLFGIIGTAEQLYSDEFQDRSMKLFHENYMPSTDILNSFLKKIEVRKLDLICPHYGSVINENIKVKIDVLKTVKCGKSYTETSLSSEKRFSELDKLKKSNFELQEYIVRKNTDKILDSVTGLYKESYFRSYLPFFFKNNEAGSIVYIRLDGMKDINNEYGYNEGDNAMSALDSILLENKAENWLLFRGTGPIIILIIPNSPVKEVLQSVIRVMKMVSESQDFIKNMTCSAAVIDLDELKSEGVFPEDILKRIVLRRLSILDIMGDNSICSSNEYESHSTEKKIMIIDSNWLNAVFLKDYLEWKNYRVTICSNGIEALNRIEQNEPSLVISDVNISQMDIFQLRKKLLDNKRLKDIPFIIISHLKNDATIKKALDLKIYHYLKRPVSLLELEGLVEFLGK